MIFKHLLNKLLWNRLLKPQPTHHGENKHYVGKPAKNNCPNCYKMYNNSILYPAHFTHQQPRKEQLINLPQVIPQPPCQKLSCGYDKTPC